MARSLSNLATVLVDLGKQTEAEAACRLALAYQEKLAADFPDIADYARSWPTARPIWAA